MRGRTLTAVLLTGGLSSRMGSDKATLTIGTEPLWKKQLRVLEGLHPEAIYLSARSKPSWAPNGIEIIPDILPSKGPMSGITAALQCLKTSHLLVLAVDMPRMTTEHLAKLWSMADPGQGVIPQQDGRLEPLCAIYPAEAVKLAEELLQQDRRAVKDFGRQLHEAARVKIHELSSFEKALYFNVNTASEFLSIPSASLSAPD